MIAIAFCTLGSFRSVDTRAFEAAGKLDRRPVGVSA
jgi:hypothetical protein